MPLYCVLGELAPAASEVIYDKFLKPMILKTWDVTYVEYQRRGLETFPEEMPRAFDWMDRHRRDPYPKSFEVVTARESDDRFYGVVVKGFGAGRTTAPEAVEVLGQNLNPAAIKMSSSSVSNLIRLDVKGISSLDLWLSPKIIDFKSKGGPGQYPHQRPALLHRPEGHHQARPRVHARRPPRPRRPASSSTGTGFPSSEARKGWE